MYESKNPSRRRMFNEMQRPKPKPFYFDKILRDRGFQPSPSQGPGTAPNMFKQRDKQGRVIRALSGIMQKGNVFKGTF